MLALVLYLFCTWSDQILAQQDLAGSTESRQESASRVFVSEKSKELGFAPSKLSEINKQLTELTRQEKVIGCSALVYCKGEEVFFGTWGLQNQRKQTPIARDTIFRIYSMTKPITSLAAMQLSERGKLDIDAPVSKYLPEFENLKVLQNKRDGKNELVAENRPMTVRDLLRHTSGLTYGFFGNTLVDQRYRKAGVLMTDKDLQITVEKLAKIPLLHQPGTRFHYSASTDVLGRVVEVASDMKFDDYLQANIFKPLDMKDSFFSVPIVKQPRFAQLYKINPKGKLTPANPLQSIRFLNEDNKFYSGGGGLCSTVDDYLEFCKMLLNKGVKNDQRVIKAQTIDEMFKNQLANLNRKSSFRFGLGFQVFPEGDFGWGGAAGTRFWVNPDKEMAIIFMMQIMPTGNRKYGEKVRKLVYESLK